jgi:CheY-like chemotaxis protein
MRVLIVEDEAIIALHLAMLIAELGHVVCATAASAAGAIALATAHNPDVALDGHSPCAGEQRHRRGQDALRATGASLHISQREPG